MQVQTHTSHKSLFEQVRAQQVHQVLCLGYILLSAFLPGGRGGHENVREHVVTLCSL